LFIRKGQLLSTLILLVIPAGTVGASTIVFDSSVSGFGGVTTITNPTATIGEVEDILGTPTIAGSLAEQAFLDAVADGLINPNDEALVFTMDGAADPLASVRIDLGDHPGAAVVIKIELQRDEVFRLTPGSNLPEWRRLLQKAIDEGGGREEIDAILDRSADRLRYEKLLDDTGLHTGLEEMVIRIDVPPGDWTINLEFYCQHFRMPVPRSQEWS